MKRKLAFLFLAAFVLCTALMVAVCVRSPNGWCDFNLRMNELACLRQGVDPYSVWHEDVVLPPYCSNLPKRPVPAGCTEQVNAYVPWAYALMLPFSYPPRHVSWFFYCLLMGAALLLTARLGATFAGEETGREDRLLASTVPLVMVSYLLWSNAAVGNFALFILAASVLMAWCLSRGHDVMAGFCWAITMIKPQSALLFAVPLLMRRKWTTCIVAAASCLVLSLVPMFFCGTSLLALLREGPAANAELFLGCGTYPRFLLGMFGNDVEIGIGLAVGALLCVVMTSCIRRERDCLTLMMPAAICGASWTYTQAYSHAMGWFVALVLVRDLVRHPRSKFLWTLMLLSFFVLTRWFLAWHGLAAVVGWQFPMSECAFRCVDSLNSTASLAIAFAYCVWKGRPRSEVSTKFSDALASVLK